MRKLMLVILMILLVMFSGLGLAYGPGGGGISLGAGDGRGILSVQTNVDPVTTIVTIGVRVQINATFAESSGTGSDFSVAAGGVITYNGPSGRRTLIVVTSTVGGSLSTQAVGLQVGVNGASFADSLSVTNGVLLAGIDGGQHITTQFVIPSLQNGDTLSIYLSNRQTTGNIRANNTRALIY